jgi:hypothetical protein
MHLVRRLAAIDSSFPCGGPRSLFGPGSVTALLISLVIIHVTTWPCRSRFSNGLEATPRRGARAKGRSCTEEEFVWRGRFAKHLRREMEEASSSQVPSGPLQSFRSRHPETSIFDL